MLENLKDRLPALPRVFRPRQPRLALEVTEEHVAMSRFCRPTLAGLSYFVGGLEAGSVRCSPVHQNVQRADHVEQVVRLARDQVAPGGGAAALCLPDSVARAILIATDTVPKKRDELQELVSWRMKKVLPYRLEEAHVETQVFGRQEKPVVLALALRRRIRKEHEDLFERQGFRVGSVTLSSLALAEQAQVAESDGDVLLLNVGASWFTMFIFNSQVPVFYRCKLLPESERHGAERDWFVAGELFPTLEYYRSRLGGQGPSKLLLHLSGPGWDALRDTLMTSVDVPIEPVPLPRPPAVPAEAWERLIPSTLVASRGLTAEAQAAVATPQRLETAS